MASYFDLDDGTLRCVSADPGTVAALTGLHVNAIAPPARAARDSGHAGTPAGMAGLFCCPRAASRPPVGLQAATPTTGSMRRAVRFACIRNVTKGSTIARRA